MCGILFCSWKKKSQINKKIIYQSLNLLKNRGPDNSKLIFHENWSMGHTRLSIIDPDSVNSNQPFTDEEGRYFLTFNGEI